MAKVDLGYVRDIIWQLKDFGHLRPDAGKALLAAADELALARAVVEAADIAWSDYEIKHVPWVGTLLAALAAYRAHVGGSK